MHVLKRSPVGSRSGRVGRSGGGGGGDGGAITSEDAAVVVAVAVAVVVMVVEEILTSSISSLSIEKLPSDVIRNLHGSKKRAASQFLSQKS